MRKVEIIISILFLVSLPLLLSGCITVKTGGGGSANTSNINGGIFKTTDKGTTWRQKVLIPTTSGKPGNIAGLDAASLVIDPSDEKTIYFGSVSSGLFYTNDGGDNWLAVKSLSKGTVRAIAIDFNAKCSIYCSIGNKVYKTSDCTRTWSPIYTDNQGTVTVDAIAIDPYNSSIAYIGVSRGDIIKSSNAGDNIPAWQTIFRAKDKIMMIVIDPNDTKVIFAATGNKGILKSTDSGNTWQNTINANLKKLNIGSLINDIVISKGETAGMYVATENGLAYSADRGETWQSINIIPPQNKAMINDLAVNPQNAKEIYYLADTIFYRSSDGGANWSTIKVPTTRAGWILVLDPKQTNVIYMGVKSLSK